MTVTGESGCDGAEYPARVRIVIFTDYDNTATLVEATLAEVERRPRSQVVAVYTTAARLLKARRRLTSWRRRVSARLRGRPVRSSRRMAEVCARYGVPLLLVPGGDPNSPDFIEDMRARFDPDTALSYWSTTIFRAGWIEAFTDAVNFHDGLIPDHRGVAATTMEVYEGLERGGFTFHRIDEGIDTGNVLVEGTIPIAGVPMLDIIEAKLVAGGARVGEVLDRLEAGDPGRSQEGEGSYTSARQISELSTVVDAAQIDRGELERRIAALGAVMLPLPGGAAVVTRLARRRGLGWPRVRLADGPVTVSRISQLPAVPWIIGRTIRGWLPSKPGR